MATFAHEVLQLWDGMLDYQGRGCDRRLSVGLEEASSKSSTITNQLAFLNYRAKQDVATRGRDF